MLGVLPDDWRLLAICALGVALALTLLFRTPYVGPALRAGVSFGVLALCLFVLLQQAPYHPWLAPLLERAGLQRQEVVGEETRIRMSPDGHFWAQVRVNGVKARMLIDTGATLTGLSTATARRAGVSPDAGAAPIFARTANGAARAQPASIDRLELGSIAARDLRVAISPALGGIDVLGMNFLTRLAGWRVEGRTLILTPKGAGQGEDGEASGSRR